MIIVIIVINVIERWLSCPSGNNARLSSSDA
jgi:hypothetical protein